MLNIEAFENPETIRWRLPPSKSHAIRWMALASQSRGITELIFKSRPGEDIGSMAECLEKMGVRIIREGKSWFIEGIDGGFRLPESTLNCGNSGTSAMILTAIAAGMNGEVGIDGDGSLRNRDGSTLTEVLKDLGCNVSSLKPPYTVSGQIQGANATLDQSISSQPLTALLLASPGYPKGTGVWLSGKGVSRGYRNMTLEICSSAGKSDFIDGDFVDLGPWDVTTPDKVEIPGELSLLPMSLLFDRLHGTKSFNYESDYDDDLLLDSILSAFESTGEDLDLRDSSDIIAPAAALLALGNGGRIIGAGHSRGKESDRISSTAYLLSAFGMDVRVTGNLLYIKGEQLPRTPEEPVEAFSDHRLAMTAIILASYCGGSVVEPGICSITDPEFIEMMGLT